MYITYHIGVPMTQEAFKLIPHQVLHQSIQDFLVERGVVENQYHFTSNNYYVFLYLDNGDRVDVQIQ